MSSKRPGDPSPESIARTHRQRIAMEEGIRAMADVEKQGVAARKNMERLRALRQAREAEQAEAVAAEILANPPKAKKRTKKTA